MQAQEQLKPSVDFSQEFVAGSTDGPIRQRLVEGDKLTDQDGRVFPEAHRRELGRVRREVYRERIADGNQL